MAFGLTRPEVGAATLVAAASLLWAGAAHAQQGWSPLPAPISKTYAEIIEPLVAVNQAGDGVAVWTRSDGVNFVPQAARFVRATRTWTPAVDLAPPSGEVVASGVSIADSGDVTIVWNRDDPIDPAARYVEAVRYIASTGAWTASTDIGGGGHFASMPQLGANAAGEAVAVWARLVVGAEVTATVHAARFVPASGSWTAVDDLSVPGGFAYFPRVVVGADGTALAVWKRSVATGEVLQASRHAGGAWSVPEDISPVESESDTPPEIAIDAAGNAVVVWNRDGVIVSRRFSVPSGTWEGILPVSGAVGETWPSIAVDPAGNALAVWTQSDIVHAARLAAGSTTWGAARALSPITRSAWWSRQPVAMDHAGNTLVAWRWSTLSDSRMQAARYTAATDTWGGSLPPLSDGGGIYSDNGSALAIDGSGSAVLIWIQPESTGHVVQTRRWEATPNAPVIDAVWPSPGVLSIDVSPPSSADPVFAPLNYEYSLDDGATWIPRTPVSLASPLVIPGLAANVSYVLRLRAVNAAGGGPATAAEVVVADARPQPPTGLVVASVVGHVVTFTWRRPPAGAFQPTGYVLEGGVRPGDVLASIPTGNTAPTVVLTVPTGAFYVRVHALAPVAGTLQRSLPSNEIRIFVNAAAPPSAPAHLLGVTYGSSLGLSWTNTYGGGAPTNVWLSVTGTLTATVPLGLVDHWTFPAVPPGTYTLRVIAENAAGASAPSNPVTLTFPGTCTLAHSAPGMPERFAIARNGRTLTVSWSPPTAGGAVNGYWLSVSGSYFGVFPTEARVLTGTVAPGSYTLDVMAWNWCGSVTTPSQTVIVP